MKTCLIIELWWIGDATLMTPILQGLQVDGWHITVLAKPASRVLLQDDYPDVEWIEFDAPWTAFHHKYRLWRWPWRGLFRVLFEVYRRRFDAAISIRRDPRDHLFIWLVRLPRRVGIRAPIGTFFLNQPLPPPPAAHHRVEDWWNAQQRLRPEAGALFPPRLHALPDLQERYRALFARDARPVLALHVGARNDVRRWPARYLREFIRELRAGFDFQLVLYPDTDGYGEELSDLADHVLTDLTLPEMKASLANARLLIANDSGPGHVADALGVPVITIFGPGDPLRIRPFSPENLVIMRDICPYRPCSDYCRFPEPYCLTQLTPDVVTREVRDYLRARRLLPERHETSLGIAVAAP